MKRAVAVAVALAILVVAAPASASEERPTLAELEAELICPTCDTTLGQSNAPVAERMREIIRQRIAAGQTKSQIKDHFVAQFGPSVLAAPEKSGFGLLAWLLPLAGLAAGALVMSIAAWRWSRGRGSDAPAGASANRGRGLSPGLERRLDEELARFD